MLSKRSCLWVWVSFKVLNTTYEQQLRMTHPTQIVTKRSHETWRNTLCEFLTEAAEMSNASGQARRHQTCHFRKRATSTPAEGPTYGLDFARHCGGVRGSNHFRSGEEPSRASQTLMSCRGARGAHRRKPARATHDTPVRGSRAT